MVVSSIIIANAKGTIVALSKECTHEQTTIDYRATQNDFMCSNHGSQFNLDGTVKQSPAVKPLTVYKTQLSTNGNSLTVMA
ncbi:MAG: Rieske (2Fe-2S) protein [Spirosomataceae bacterium]